MNKKILIAGLAIVLMVGIVSAAVISYFGQVKMTATVNQAVLLDGTDITGMPITEDATVAGGESFCRHHWLESQTSVPVNLQFETTFSPALTNDEITVSYLKSTDYEKTVTTVGSYPITVTAEDVGEWIQWTFYMDSVSGDDDKLAGQVVISFDGETPAFQIHNNDGVTPDYAVGTWLYCPYDPIIGWGTVGDPAWNTPVADLWWVEAEGTMHNNAEGKLIVRIHKTMLDATFYWAVAGSRYYTEPRGTFVYPDGFNWIKPYEEATILEPITQPFTLQPMERLDFYICYDFAPNIKAGTYYITSTVELASTP